MTKNTYGGTVALLNVERKPIGKVDFPKAMRMLFRKVAVVEKGDETRKIGQYAWPEVIRLLREVVRTWLDKPAKWHRGGVFIRDGHRCAYCNSKATTLDHVFPKSRGGLWEWTNIVAACASCNEEKADRTPEEAGMPLVYATPFVPTVGQILRTQAA